MVPPLGVRCAAHASLACFQGPGGAPAQPSLPQPGLQKGGGGGSWRNKRLFRCTPARPTLFADGTAAPRVLSGAGGSGVTALLVLPGQPAPCWLLSGSRDSCVVWWDLFTGEALHRFALDAGPIARLLLSPDSCRVSRGPKAAPWEPNQAGGLLLLSRVGQGLGKARGGPAPFLPRGRPTRGALPDSLLYPDEEVFLALSLQRKGHRLVCCVCSDHSIVLLHVQERACLLRARKHLFPVTALRWHPMENLLVVGCENDSVYVWDIETGERGEAAPVPPHSSAAGSPLGLLRS